MLHFHKSLISLIFLFLGISHAVISQDAPKRELRAAWIATVENIDWPSQKGLPAAQQQAEYVALLDTLKAAGMNAVIMQIRPTADAFYPSSYEPWSAYLTGKQGEAPSPYYNPLEFMINEARKRGMEFHGWFNPYRASNNKEFIPSADHPLVQHPEWFVQYGGKWYYDPGIPAAQEFVLQSIIEVVKHYDMDAVHFDDYFYPYKIANEAFPDSSSYANFGKRFDDLEDWRRYNVDYFVEELSKRIKAEKPLMKFGISPFGVWRNQDKDPLGSATRAGQTNYDDLYADVLKWLREGWIDYVTPQIYWHIGFELAEYKTLVKWWAENSYGRHVYIGQGVYRVGQKGWEDKNEVVNQIQYNRTFPEVKGSMFFSAKTIAGNKENVNSQLTKAYPNPALPPEMPWIDQQAPQSVQTVKAKGSPASGITLNWEANLDGDASYFVIYRFEEDEKVDTSNPNKIYRTVQKGPYALQEWKDNLVNKRSNYTYCITAVDRLHNESEPSRPIKIVTKGKRKVIKTQ
ncbi:family 10 glycosylhydrolase [Echinicola sp. CAU 1574]|uniref:Family 10 glycosylhydrolase n=1 Tax=Echinicola arenosa TaxID=2774144 RepID=A0ABR9AGQ7_9BACT|nr:family 10 glycosylhydrolase [Echinicola arenosa]MBD8487921.1 family 10 glycosylhydrolase [Echinicola arenosa]